jgi:hypothetical protein
MTKTVIFSLAIALLTLIFITSCEKNWKTYVVKAGNHSTNELNAPLLNFDKIEFSFRANSSWYYDEPANPGWNKIRGISHGHHHDNSSARLAYQCLHDTMLIVGAYCYVNGVTPQQNPNQKTILDTIVPGKTYNCSIIRENDMYLFHFEDIKWTCPAGENMSWGYKLNPYVGGEFTLDHDWVVEIKDRK